MTDSKAIGYAEAPPIPKASRGFDAFTPGVRSGVRPNMLRMGFIVEDFTDKTRN
ncbi:MAG: hypothetical protein QGF68_12315 [Nitrospinota bacterium]|jgi:hypothetical protein|nr:hypothetical protein [Nitrospinota bacterium]HJM43164.1 hypothetical protein [Nitrospinota bacterium]